jgi:hypothetical protein
MDQPFDLMGFGTWANYNNPLKNNQILLFLEDFSGLGIDEWEEGIANKGD